MGGILGGDSSPPPPPPPPPVPPPAPTLDMAKSNQKQQDAATARRGRAANVLTSNQGDLSSTSTSGTKQLLGG